MWLRSLFNEIGISIQSLPLLGDNQGSIFLASNPIQERRTKHIDRRFHYIRERVELNEVELFYVHTEDNIADILTKNLALVKFTKFKDLSGITFEEKKPFWKLTFHEVHTSDPGTLDDRAAKSLSSSSSKQKNM